MKTISAILTFISLFNTIVYAQENKIFITGSTNLFFLDRHYAGNTNSTIKTAKNGQTSPGFGLGFTILSPINHKSSISSDLDFSFKRREHYFITGAIYFRVPETLIFNTLKVSTKYDYNLHKNIYISLGGFLEYVLDKNQNFSYIYTVFSPFNFGPTISADLRKNAWIYKLSYEHGLANVIDYNKGEGVLPEELIHTIKLKTIQFSIGYQLYH